MLTMQTKAPESNSAHDNVWKSETGVGQWSQIGGILSIWHWLKVGYLPALCSELGGSFSGKRILDVGCGEGRVTRLYGDHYHADTVGIDTSEGMIQSATRAPSNGVKFMCVKENQFPFPDCHFDSVIANWVLMAIGERNKLATFAREVHRVLKPGSSFVTIVNNCESSGKPCFSYQSGETGAHYKSGDVIPVKFFDQDSGSGKVVMQFDDFYWTEEDYVSALQKGGFVHVSSFVPHHMNPEVTQEIKSLQAAGLFPNVPYREDRFIGEHLVRVLIARKAL